MARRDVHSQIVYFSQNDKFKAEKPYTTAFSVADQPGAIPSNHGYDMVVHDVRKHDDFDLNTAGFRFIKHNTSLTRENFDSIDIVEDRYSAEINDFVQKIPSQYSVIAFLEYEIRKRSKHFPQTPGAEATHDQPLTLPHVDYTPDHAVRRLEKALGGQHQELLKQPYEVLKQVHHVIERTLMSLSIWRLLKGPNNDWPLALCDYRTVNPERDSLSNDILFREETGENMLLKYNGAHRWYYMSDQDVDDIIDFRNTHTNSPKSASPKSARAWHASFFNSGAGSGHMLEPRCPH